MNLKDLVYEDFPCKSYDKLRFGDTDRLGHVNNAKFSTFLETGSDELLLINESLADEGCTFVIANLNLNFISEILWPGTVQTGTGVTKIGNSSIELYQCIFQNGKRVADATSIIVQMDETTRKSRPLTEASKKILENYTV